MGDSRSGGAVRIAGVPDLAHHLASFARFATARGEREREDADAMRELAASPLELAPGLELEWLGVAGYRMTYERQTLYIDPYLSRVPLANVIRRRTALADPALHERYLRAAGRVVGVLVGHTHFDHAIDVPAIARRYDCAAYGSSSLVQLMRLHGLAERAVEVRPAHRYELGPFVVTFVPSLHSKLLLGYAVPFDGELTCEHLDALSPAAYRCGQVWGIHVEVAGMTFYHQGSANLIDEELRHSEIDVFLAGIAGRSFTVDYWQRILRGLAPRTVVASHFDDFFRPLDAKMGFSTNVNLAAVPDEVARVSRDFAVATLPLLAPVGSGG
jgi:L-ascorbate metabolism protein UlaG (beta-lactamase superfamily)